MKHTKIAALTAQLSGAVLLCGLAVGVIAYAAGYYDLSFVQRQSAAVNEGEQEGSADGIVTPGTEVSPQTVAKLPAVYRVGESVRSFYTYPEIDAEKQAKYLSAALSVFSPLQDGTQSEDLIYGDGVRLSYVNSSVTLPGAFTYSKTTERTVTKKLENAQGLTSFTVGSTEVDRPAMTLQGGYLIMQTEQGYGLYDAAGNLLLSDYDADAYTLTYYDDGQGRALFEGQDGGYYRFENGAFVSVSYDPDTEPWQLLCDLPAYYKGDGTTTVYLQDGKWGYKSADGTVLSDAIYRCAYAHRDGIAIAYDDENIYFLDGQCNVLTQKPYHTDDVFLTGDEITVPATFGEEFYGLNYFDHGMTVLRARQCLFSYHTYIFMKTDDDARLFDANGNRVSQPDGFELKGYADGIRLLQKEDSGLYGYMDNDGNWVVDPAFSYGEPFYQGLAAVGYADGKKGLIDTEGNIVLPMVFDYVSNVSHGTVVAYDSLSGWVMFRLEKTDTAGGQE